MITYPDLKNKKALVTGASKGIGHEICMLFLQNNMEVYGLARSSEAMLDLELKYTNFRGITADLSNNESIEQAVVNIPNLDILVHNAGYFNGALLQDMSLKNWEQHIQINLTAPFLLTKLLWEKLSKCKPNMGSIIFISSLAGVHHKEKFPTTTAYTASKMGLVGFMEVIASEGKHYNIRANCISPGSVNTEMLQKAFPNMKADFTTTNIANSVAYFASSISEPITGTNFVISI